MSRGENWFQTYTGRKFYPLDPNPDEICIEDIAHALAMQCRFGGHCRAHYSVAQHCTIGSLMVRGEDALAFLLHDASEAYLCDLPRPLKHGSKLFGWLYRRAEKRLDGAIAVRFAIPRRVSYHVALMDARMLATEKRDLLLPGPGKWRVEHRVLPIEARIVPVSPFQAEADFLERFTMLTGPEWFGVERHGLEQPARHRHGMR